MMQYLVQSSLHIPPIYYQYLKKVDYVLLPKWILQVGKNFEINGHHYLTGSKVISGVPELMSVLRNLRPCQKLWILTDYFMRDGEFFYEDINSVFEDFNWKKVFTGKDGKTFVYLINSCSPPRLTRCCEQSHASMFSSLGDSI